ncbi:hypothetical protein HMI54_009255 [Coelomomyces lativittatus]|nr:hypothetical protein HMI56_003972 [Coelomomyces lativittatus]KAJ1515048.1 hypothetical protein HMI55_004094 [Coelomomyces lativittatus]KAJ1516491.1 hypothetical protein HMI54_009255 [Coelomomyces lativittatus]
MDINELFNVQNKVILVTGGSRGIGLMIARGFVRNGARVYISSRSASVCDEVAKTLTQEGPGVCFSIPCNLQSIKEINQLVQTLMQKENYLDILVNNAGATWGASLEDYPDSAFNKVMQLNVNHVFTLTKLCLPLLRTKTTPENPSRIINIGSVDGLRVPLMETYAYVASKAALHQLTKVLAKQLAKDPILVNAIAPGPFESKMMASTLTQFRKDIENAIPLHRIGHPSDIVGISLFLASKASNFITGSILPLDGGLLVSAHL